MIVSRQKSGQTAFKRLACEKQVTSIYSYSAISLILDKA